MKAKDLCNSILQMAVQGKLVPQDPNDEPASVLLERIRAERAQLIKEKKIKAPKGGESVIYRASDGSHYEKRGKGEPVCIDDEIPFDIPESWEWVRLEDLGMLQTGKTPSTSHQDFFDGPIPFVTPGDITYEHTLPAVERSLSAIGSQHSRMANSQSILQVCIGGSAGKTCLVVNKVAFNQQINAITCYLPAIAEYLYLALCAPLVQSHIEAMKTGTATPIINKSVWSKFLIPLPPIAEQEAIVVKMGNLHPIIEQYGNLESSRERLDAELPDHLRKSILQLAVQGRLVEQDPSDEPASVLLEHIRAERAALVKAGKLKAPKGGESVIYRSSDGGYYEKRGKGEPICIDDEIPFEIPESWVWARLASLATKITDGTHRSPPNTPDGQYMYVTAKNIKDDGVHTEGITYVSKEVHEEIYARCNPSLGDVLLIKDGATTGVVTVNNVEEEFSLLSSVALVKLPEGIESWYIAFYLRSEQFNRYIKSLMSGTGIPRITLKKIEPLLVPIPPFSEQQRIITKIEEVLTNQ